jgi:hypothetical protein
VIAALRQSGVDAPIFVAIETGYCDGRWTPPKPNNPIAEAQRRGAQRALMRQPARPACANASVYRVLG